MKEHLSPGATITCVQKGSHVVHCIMVTARASEDNYIYTGKFGAEHSTPTDQSNWLLGCINNSWHHVTTVHESDGVVTTTCSILGPRSESKGLMWLNLLTYEGAVISFKKTDKGWTVKLDGYETHFDSNGAITLSDRASHLPDTIMKHLSAEMCYGYRGYWNFSPIVNKSSLKICLITGRFGK